MFKKLAGLLLALSLSLLVVQCKKDGPSVENSSKKSDDATLKDKSEKKAVVEEEVVPMKYTAFVLPKKKKDSAMSAFKAKYSEAEQYTILALNRLDNKNRWRADTLIIPEKLSNDFLIYSPFPKKIDALADVKKMVFFSYAVSAFAAYENGILKKWGPSSLGKKNSQTERGLTFTNWKSEMATSTVDPSWKLGWNFNIYNKLGIGWHQYDLPGYHASHSCLRLLNEDAKWLYQFADQWVLDAGGNNVLAKGTPVMVFGDSDFKTKTWRNLLKNPDANTLSPKLMDETISPFVSKILEEQKNSEEMRSKKSMAKTDGI